MHSESYWLDTAPVFTSAQTEALPARVDVVVVGGGFTGLSAARALALKGAGVAVLEAERGSELLVPAALAGTSPSHW